MTNQKSVFLIWVGGGSGYGAGIAQRFAREGAKVVVADINEAGGQKIANSVPEMMSFHKTNVAKKDDWDLLLEKAYKSFGRIDCLVNNAGTTYRNKASQDAHISTGAVRAKLLYSPQQKSPNRISRDASTSMSEVCFMERRPSFHDFLPINKGEASST